MRINSVNNQSFPANYLLKFRDGAGLEAHRQLRKFDISDDSTVIPLGDEIILLTGQDHLDFQRIRELYNGRKPLLSSEAEKELIESFKKNSQVVDLKDKKFYA